MTWELEFKQFLSLVIGPREIVPSWLDSRGDTRDGRKRELNDTTFTYWCV